jgi:hypothetical protein
VSSPTVRTTDEDDDKDGAAVDGRSEFVIRPSGNTNTLRSFKMPRGLTKAILSLLLPPREGLAGKERSRTVSSSGSSSSKGASWRRALRESIRAVEGDGGTSSVDSAVARACNDSRFCRWLLLRKLCSICGWMLWLREPRADEEEGDRGTPPRPLALYERVVCTGELLRCGDKGGGRADPPYAASVSSRL